MLTLLFAIAAFVLAEAAFAHRDQWSRRRIAAVAGLGALALIGAAATIPNMLYLGKVLGRLAMPVGLLWIALAVHVAWRWHRRQRRELTLAIAAFVIFSLVGSPLVGRALLDQLERPYRDIEILEGPTLEAVFVMGGGTGTNPHGEPILSSSGDRVYQAARLAKEGRTELLVTSGSTIAGLGSPRDLAQEAASVLSNMGVEGNRIVHLPGPKNSSQEIAAYAQLTQERGWTRVGLLSSAWHLRRAEGLADRAGLKVEPLPADFRGGAAWDGILSIIPDGAGFRDLTTACWEYLGAAVGR